MTIPSTQLRHRVDLDGAISLLRALEHNCLNEAQPVMPTSHPAPKRDAYVLWATKTEGELRSVLSEGEIAKLFSGPRHRDICSMSPGAQLLPMIHAEVNDHSTRFRALADQLELARNLFQGAGTCLVPDTSFYIEYPEKLEDVDFHLLAQQQGPIRVLIPIVVIDELDGLKNRGSKEARWRASHTLAVVDRVVADPPGPGILRPGTHLPPRGDVTLQIVFDPPEHERMPINDDEIVDRCVTCEPFAGKVTVVTYDTGQFTRARMAELKARKLTHDLGPEPTAT